MLILLSFHLILTSGPIFIAKNHLIVCGCFLRQVLGVRSIRIFAKNMGDPYYEPTIVVHDNLFIFYFYKETKEKVKASKV